METREPRLRRADVIARAALIALLALLVSLPSLWYGFALDDMFHIVDNGSIRQIASGLRSFGEPVYPGNLYRPLVIFSYALTYAAVGLDPLAYHLGNVLLHAAASVLAYLVLRRLVAEWPAALAAVVFAVHPVHVEAIANVSGRSELLSAVFSLASLLLLSGGTGMRRAALASAAFLLALLSKESAVTVLLLAPLIWWRRDGSLPRDADARRFAGAASVFLLSALSFYLYLRHSALSGLAFDLGRIHHLDNPLAALPASERALNAISLLGRYLLLAFFPAVLRSDYSYAEITPIFEEGFREGALWYALTSVALVIAAIGLLRRRAYGALLGWFFLSFAVTSNVFVPIGTIFGERLLYLPSIGVSGLMALGLYELSAPLRNLCSLLLMVTYSSVFALNAPHWTNNHTLHRRAVEVSPGSAKSRANHAVVLLSGGKVEAARSELRRALRIEPSYVNALHLQAVAHILGGEPETGRRWLVQALNMDPGYLPALNFYGRLLVERGENEEAKRIFGQVLRLSPRDIRARTGLAALCAPPSPECEREISALDEELALRPDLAGLKSWLSERRSSMLKKAEGNFLAATRTPGRRAQTPKAFGRRVSPRRASAG